MKFNLTLAKAGWSVRTKSGYPVRILCFDRKNTEYKIVALILVKEGLPEKIEYYTLEGKYYGLDQDSENDLILA